MKIKTGPDLSLRQIRKQLHLRRPLPLGRQEFEEWSDRIIAGALLEADVRSQKFVLADVLLHLGPTEDHKEDSYFIHTLRKMAVNQVAIMLRAEIKAERDAETAAQTAKEAEEKLNAETAAKELAESEAKASLGEPETWKAAAE